LTVAPDIAASLGLSAARVGVGAGFGGDGAVLRGNYRAARLGPLDLADVEIDAPTLRGGDLSRPGRANIGNRLLARFDAVTLDYERRLLTLESAQSAVGSRQ
jgi:hypothetical protein